MLNGQNVTNFCILWPLLNLSFENVGKSEAQIEIINNNKHKQLCLLVTALQSWSTLSLLLRAVIFDLKQI